MIKKYLTIAIVGCLLISTVLLTPIASAQDEISFEQTNEWSKVGMSLQHIWLGAKQNNAMSQKVECFVVLRDIAGSGDRDILFGAGFAAQVLTGTVARGHMEIGALPNVASLQFVRKINLATK